LTLALFIFTSFIIYIFVFVCLLFCLLISLICFVCIIGQVWKGNWRSTEVAIKQVKQDKQNEKVLVEFWAEASLVAKIRPHVNLVQFLGVCVSPLCVIYEFLPGGDLRTYLDKRENAIEFGRALIWFRGLFLPGFFGCFVSVTI
jgi:serine/threonine protein kinase